jgi:hypothetical protein
VEWAWAEWTTNEQALSLGTCASRRKVQGAQQQKTRRANFQILGRVVGPSRPAATPAHSYLIANSNPSDLQAASLSSSCGSEP